MIQGIWLALWDLILLVLLPELVVAAVVLLGAGVGVLWVCYQIGKWDKQDTLNRERNVADTVHRRSADHDAD